MNPISLSTHNVVINKGAGLSSEMLQAALYAYAVDLAKIQDAINNNILKIVNGLPTDTGVDPVVAETMDGAHMFADSSLSSTYDVFYNDSASRPMTIYEALIALADLAASNAGTNYRSITDSFDYSEGVYEYALSTASLVQKDPLSDVWLTHFALYYFPAADNGKGYRIYSANGSDPDDNFFDIVDDGGGGWNLTLSDTFKAAGDLELVAGDKLMLEYSLGTTN